MKRNPQLYIADIDTAIHKIRKYVLDRTEVEFTHDELLQDAVIRNLEIIGEAVKHLPKDLTNSYPSIPWKTIAGLRDILIHEYFGVQLHQIWLIITNELLLFHDQIQMILKSNSEPDLFNFEQNVGS